MLKTIRVRSGVTQSQLAERVGVSVRAIRKWEKLGIRHATLGNAEKAAAALGCEVADLLCDPEGEAAVVGASREDQRKEVDSNG